MIRKPILIDSGTAYTSSGLVHRVLEPSSAGPHPTVVMLHGRLGNEEVMWIFQQTLPAGWLAVAPRAIVAEAENSYSWHPRPTQLWPTLSQFDDAVTAVTHFIDALPHLYNANPQQIYLMGFSQGAATAYATAMQQPGRFRGIAGLVGFMPAQTEAIVQQKPLQDLPVFMAAGAQDETIPLAVSQHCADQLQEAGALLAYHEYPIGHKLSAAAMRELKQWWVERAEEGR